MVVALRALVMGAGAVGGLYGGLLARRGHAVTFVARGAHLEAMRANGLMIRAGGETRVVRPVTAIGSAAEARGPFDLVLFTVKGYDTERAAAGLPPLLGPETAVLTLQNGVENAERLERVLGPGHALPGATYVVAGVAEPGVIAQGSAFRRIVFGEPSGDVTARATAIAGALQDAGIETTLSPQPALAVWQKFAMQAPNATITSACRATVGAIRATAEGAALYRAAIAEVVAVARAGGVPFPEDAEAAAFAIVQSMPVTGRSSMQVDFDRGKRVELEELTGAVVRLGRDAGVPTPLFETLYALLAIRRQTGDNL